MKRLLLLLSIVLLVSVTTLAKGPTVRLTVAGPGLAAPVDIRTPEAIRPSVWGGEFIGQPAAEPPAVLRRYLVSFHVDLPRDQGVRVMYVVKYARDPFTGQGFVYLPGRQDTWGEVNRHTIGRDGQDGRWHRAERRWSDAVAAALP